MKCCELCNYGQPRGAWWEELNGIRVISLSRSAPPPLFPTSTSNYGDLWRAENAVHVLFNPWCTDRPYNALQCFRRILKSLKVMLLKTMEMKTNLITCI